MSFDREQFEDLIVRVLKEMNAHSDAAVNLLLGTAAQESGFGTYLRQIGSGVARGVFQMEPVTEFDIWSNFLRYKIELKSMITNVSKQFEPSVLALESNIAYQIAMARCHYLRVPEVLPSASDVPGMAEYWKRYWNTERGKGTVDEFIINYNRFVWRA